MSIVQMYKEAVPPVLRNRIASIPFIQRWKNRQLVQEGEQLARKIRTDRGEDGKIHVSLMETRRAFWLNHASIYEAMSEDGDFEVNIFAVPKRSPRGDMDWAEYRRLIDFFDRKRIPCVHAYDLARGVWHNPLRFGLPDVVFLSQPYDFQQNFMYGSAYWSHFCKVVFLGYGLTLIDRPAIFQAPCFVNCQYIFFEHEIHRELLRSYSPEQEGKLIVSGHPSLDGYLSPLKEFERLQFKSPASKRRVIWAPHFTVSSDNGIHGFSHFFDYYGVLVQLAKNHPELEIVMRPHPALFTYMVNVGLKTPREAEEYRDGFNALPNARIYEEADYISLFRQSDALVLDSVGFIGAYAPTGNPVCFLESAKRERLNSIGERLLHADYAAWDADEIREFVERVVLGGDDWKKAEREAAVKKLIYIPPEGAGTRIAREIKTRLHAERKKGAPHGHQ